MRLYLASPYSHPDPAVRQERHDQACKAAATLMVAGHQVFSPIAHSHAVGAFLPTDLLLDHSFWMAQDLPYISHWAEEVWVLTIDGYDKSRGVARELQAAQEYGRHVRFYSPGDKP